VTEYHVASNTIRLCESVLKMALPAKSSGRHGERIISQSSVIGQLDTRLPTPGQMWRALPVSGGIEGGRCAKARGTSGDPQINKG
jgi:hypothetical protein